jgi:hypothetical protein
LNHSGSTSEGFDWRLWLRWVLTSTLSLIIIGGLYGALFGGATTALAWVALIAGTLALGISRQRMLPDKEFIYSAPWRTATVLGLGLGVLVVALVFQVVARHLGQAALWALAGGLFGFVEGAVTGTVLVRLLARRQGKG